MMQFLFTKTPLAYLVASFWRDEAFSYLMAKQPILKMLLTTAQDANPPLYYVLLKVWMSFCGHSEVALRILSFIFFWGTLYTVFLILNEIVNINTKKSILYLALFVANPLLHYYAFEARMYSLMTFLATLTFYLLFKKRYRAYAIVALCSLYTHYFLYSVVVMQVAVSLFLLSQKDKSDFMAHLKKYLVWIVPWFIFLICARPPIAKSFWIDTFSFRDMLLFPGILFTGYEKSAGFVYKPLLLVSAMVSTIIVFGISFFLNRTGKKWITKSGLYQYTSLIGWSICIPLVVFIFSFIKPIFLPRYLIFSTVGLLIYIIIIIERSMRVRMKYVIFAALFITSLHYAGVQVALRTKAPIKKTFTEIKQMLKPDDVVYVLHEYDFHPAEYYINDSQVYIYKKEYEELPWFVGKVLIPKNKVTSTLPQYPHRAFIVQPNGTSYTIQSMY